MQDVDKNAITTEPPSASSEELKTHRLRDLGLQIEGQPLLGAARHVVQMAAHGPKEAPSPQEAVEPAAGQHVVLDEVVPAPGVVDVPRQPDQGL